MTRPLTLSAGAWLPLLFAAVLCAGPSPAAYAQDDMADADPTLEAAGADDRATPAEIAEAIEENPNIVEVADPAAALLDPSDVDITGYTIDNLFLFFCAVLVLFMQAGFAMVVAGFCPSKHTVNILFKNALDLGVGVLLFYVVGFNLMYPGDDGAIADGYVGKIALGMDETAAPGAGTLNPQIDFLFQVAFAATAATIVAGAVAGRMKFGAYLVYSAVLTGLVYPLSGYWKWGGGFLDQMGFYDFAGCGVVHMVGGFAGLAGALVLGPRLGRYTPDGKPVAAPGHSLPLATLGTFILLIGWFGFNPGSQLAIYGADNTDAVAKIAVNTLLAGAAGAVVATFVSWGLFGKPDLSMGLNGMLGGLVGITANCDGVSNNSALIIGAVAGALVVAAIIAMDKVRIDDPVGAFPVHGVCGMWGLLAIPLFATYGAVDDANPDSPIYGNAMAQIVGLLCYAAWAFVTMFVLFFVLKMVGFLRVSAEDEERGLDISEHGMTAYST